MAKVAAQADVTVPADAMPRTIMYRGHEYVLASSLVASGRSAESLEASAHYVAQDIPCPHAKPCEKTFRTAKGAAWHVENQKH